MCLISYTVSNAEWNLSRLTFSVGKPLLARPPPLFLPTSSCHCPFQVRQLQGTIKRLRRSAGLHRRLRRPQWATALSKWKSTLQMKWLPRPVVSGVVRNTFISRKSQKEKSSLTCDSACQMGTDPCSLKSSCHFPLCSGPLASSPQTENSTSPWAGGNCCWEAENTVFLPVAGIPGCESQVQVRRANCIY